MKRYFLLLCAAAALFFLYGCGEKTAEEALLKAEFHARSGKWQNALKSAERAVTLEPENPTALLFLALACEKNKLFDRALDAARHAATLVPDDFYAQYTLGRLYAQDATRQTEAFKALSRAYKLRPKSTDALILLTNTAMELRSPAAFKLLMELRSKADFTVDAVYSNELGIAYLRQRNISAARKELFRACASKDPRVILNTAIFLDRYMSQKQNARNFYNYYLRMVGNSSGYAVRRELVEARLRQL
ncbi:MAG: tetratricopeptide repeat protein [Lentisphaeria bacterium]|nr:tetratricopeptide repeat protein [Lentisphaeria bacterium]